MTTRGGAIERALLGVDRLSHLRARALSVRRRRRSGRAFADLRERYYADLWARAGAEIGAVLEPVGYGCYAVRRGGRITFVDSTGAFTDSRLGAKIALNKVLTVRLLEEEPGYRGAQRCVYALSTLHRARGFLGRSSGSVVVKPAQGGYAGRGVTAGVRTQRALRLASIAASPGSGELIAEEHVEGASYRLLFLEGSLLQVVKRGRPTVVGNGRDSIRRLMAAETAGRLRDSPFRALHPLQPDLDARLALTAQGLTLGSVPSAGQRVVVKTVVNQAGSEDSEVVDAPVHPSIRALGARISSLLDLPLAGLDVITKSLATDLAESGGVVNEVNAQPGLHHHDLVRNRRSETGVAAEVLEHVLRHAPRDRGARESARG